MLPSSSLRAALAAWQSIFNSGQQWIATPLKRLAMTTTLWGLTISAVISFSSCSDKKDYDKSKAVLAYAINDSLVEDITLKNSPTKIPAQIKTSSSLAFAENSAFEPQKNSKDFLSEESQIWSGYRGAFDDRFVFAPVIIDKKIYLLDASGVLAAYELGDQKKPWEKLWESRIFPRKFLKNYQNPRISIFKNKIFAVAGINQIAAASINDGKILWSKNILSIPISTPIADENLVYFTTNENKTYALEANNGNLIWVANGVNKSTAIFGAATPLLHKNMLIVAYSSGEIYALNRENGEPLWSQDLNVNKAGDSDFYLNDIDATPIIKNDILYAVGNGGLMMAIDTKNGQYVWRKEIASIVNFWIAGNFIYAINNDNKLIALERGKGAVKWVAQLPNFKNEKNLETKIIYNGVILAGNKLLISDSRGRLLVASPGSGKIEQTFKLGQKISHAPIVVDGRIYLHALGKYTVNLIEVE